MPVGVLAKSISDLYLRAGQTMKLEPRAVGAILDKFGIPRTRRNSGYEFWIHVRTRELTHRLAGKYGLHLPMEILTTGSSVICEYCERTWEAQELPVDDEELELGTECHVW